MAWTTPRTWVAGELVTATMLNTHIRDNENLLKTSINDDGTLKQPPGLTLSFNYGDAGRYNSTVVGSGANTFGPFGLVTTTGASATSSANTTFSLGGGANSDAKLGSPRIYFHLFLSVKGTDATSYFGLGGLTVAGAGITFTGHHAGFKVVWAASGAATLFATQGDGSTEAASSALATIVVGDELDLSLQFNALASVDYYWRKNGGAQSVATNIATNMPTSALSPAQASVSNVSVASTSTFAVQGAAYIRTA